MGAGRSAGPGNIRFPRQGFRRRLVCAGSGRVSAAAGGLEARSRSGRPLFAMQDTSWDHALEVTGDGLVGHAGGILLRKLADRSGLTAELETALTPWETSPQVSRGMAMVSAAIAIAMGATSMADTEVLGQLGPVLGPAPSDSTVRRTLHLADDQTLTRVAQARARIRKHVWELIEATPCGFPWLAVAGKTLAGWTVIDMDGTLVTASSDMRMARSCGLASGAVFS